MFKLEDLKNIDCFSDLTDIQLQDRLEELNNDPEEFILKTKRYELFLIPETKLNTEYLKNNIEKNLSQILEEIETYDIDLLFGYFIEKKQPLIVPKSINQKFKDKFSYVLNEYLGNNEYDEEELFEKNFNLSQIENEINKINKENKNDKKFD